jgi:aminopeptidase N
MGITSCVAGEASRPDAGYDGQLHLSFSSLDTIPAGNLTINIKFSYPLSDGLLGFYKSTYEAGGKNYTLASTMMEPMSARKAIPCFEEPWIKVLILFAICVPGPP